MITGLIPLQRGKVQGAWMTGAVSKTYGKADADAKSTAVPMGMSERRLKRMLLELPAQKSE